MVEITGDELIGDVVAKYPRIAPILTRYGLHCVGCHVNQYESIREGVKVHGMPDEVFDNMIAEINTFLNRKIETLEVTDMACYMIDKYATEDGKQGQGLKITVSEDTESPSGFAYEMEFVQTPADGDEIFTFGKDKDVQVFVDKESYKLLKGSEIDFVDSVDDSGFRIENPNKKK